VPILRKKRFACTTIPSRNPIIQIILLSLFRLLDNSFYIPKIRPSLAGRIESPVATLVANGSIAGKFREMVGKFLISDLKSILTIF
jgi:hypothetical protein